VLHVTHREKCYHLLLLQRLLQRRTEDSLQVGIRHTRRQFVPQTLVLSRPRFISNRDTLNPCLARCACTLGYLYKAQPSKPGKSFSECKRHPGHNLDRHLQPDCRWSVPALLAEFDGIVRHWLIFPLTVPFKVE
jgi:hypothetical protein